MADKKLNPPSAVKARATNLDSVRITWKDETGGLAEYYKVERRVAGGAWSLVSDGINGTAEEYENNGALVALTRYEYRVTALSSGVQETTQVTLPAASVLPPSGTGGYLDFTKSNDTILRIWFDVSSGNTAPATPSGGALLEVNVDSGDTSTQVATKFAAAVEAHADFTASSDAAIATVQNVDLGTRVDAVNVSAGATIVVLNQGVDVDSDAVSSNEVITQPGESGNYYAAMDGDTEFGYIAAITLASPFLRVSLFPITAGKNFQNNVDPDTVLFGNKINGATNFPY